jgi:hypothetical protein
MIFLIVTTLVLRYRYIDPFVSLWFFIPPVPEGEGVYCFTSVRLSVRPSVHSSFHLSFRPSKIFFSCWEKCDKNVYKCSMCIKTNYVGKQEVGISDFCHQQLLRKMRRKISWTDGRTNGRTNGQTDGQTDGKNTTFVH